jgi:hypothetical protein
VIGGENLIFAASRGGHVREMGYSLNKNGYTTNDLSLRCPDLFDGLTVTDMAMSKSPYPIIWFVSSNGKLIGLTYVPEQSLAAWHQHDTDGSFESVAVVAEGNEDAVYVIVRRTISGATVRYVERFASRAFATQADAFFVDAGATYSGSPISTVTAGIAHLEGKTVAILGDGAVRPPQVVTGGQITLDQPASKLQIGLPITADAYTLPVAFQTDGMGQGRRKNVSKVWLRVVKSGAFLAGPSLTTLTETKIRTTEVFGSPPALQSREIALAVQPGWTDGGQVYIRNQDPVPLLIASMSLQVVVGGG